MHPIITWTLVAAGIVAALFATNPSLQSVDPFNLQDISANVLVDEERHISPGKSESYQILTADSKTIRLEVYPQDAESKVAVKVYYPEGQNKTFDGKEHLNYIVDFHQSLDVAIIPEQNSTINVEFQPFTQSNLHVKISLRHE